MKSQKELLEIAEAKTAILVYDNTQIRLTADAGCDYWLFRKNNKFYIGFMASEPMPRFWSNRPGFQMEAADGRIIGELQFFKHIN